MATKKKQSSGEDMGHWETAREKEKAMKAPLSSGVYVQQSKLRSKKITPTDSNSSVKYNGKEKTTRKRIAAKK